MRTGQTTAIYFISKVIGSGLGFAGTVYFARVLGPGVLGHYFLILSITGWLGIVGKLGITKAVTKRLSENNESSAYLIAGAVLMTLFGILISTGVLLFTPAINSYVGTTAGKYIPLLLFPILFVGLVNAALHGQHLVHVSGVLSTLKIGIRSLFQIALVWAGFQLVGMIAGFVIGAVVTGLFGIRYLKVGSQWPKIYHFRRLFDFAKYAWLGSIRGRAYSQMDILVLGAFISSSLVGIYSVAWSLAAFLSLFGKSVQNAVFPEISKQTIAQEQDSVRGLATDGLGFAGLITIPGLVGGLILADQLLLIYGPEFTRGATVLAILIGAVLINEYLSQCLNVLNAIDRPDLSFKANAAYLSSNLILNILLIWQYGMIGAAFATLFSAAVGLGLSYWMVSRLVAFRSPIGHIKDQAISATVMGLCVYTSREFLKMVSINLNVLIDTMILVVIGGITYVIVLSAISNGFREVISRNMGGIFT